ncbi:MAG: hypothetical protein ACQKBY_09840 [Verrucomicrobiales bacterium]
MNLARTIKEKGGQAGMTQPREPDMEKVRKAVEERGLMRKRQKEAIATGGRKSRPVDVKRRKYVRNASPWGASDIMAEL